MSVPTERLGPGTFATMQRLQAENIALRAELRRLTGKEPGEVRPLTPFERFRQEIKPLLGGPRSNAACMAAVRYHFDLPDLADMTDVQLPEAIAFVHAWVRVQ